MYFLSYVQQACLPDYWYGYAIVSGLLARFATLRHCDKGQQATLQDAGWNVTDGSSVMFEYAPPNGTQADYALWLSRTPYGGVGGQAGEHRSGDGAGPGAALRRNNSKCHSFFCRTVRRCDDS